ncbi:MAG TPA: winged helix-turn-helix domain-containing protein [Nitrososphaerales archaeon]|nr:winged helix-turn-helix domain-containing protein [Nitrososphaerales archaeon]
MSRTQGSGFGMAADAAGQIRRSPMEMVCDILAVVSGGPTKPTHILYKANMSWKVLSSYLDFLTGSGMLDKEEQEGGKRSTYRLTTKGKQILRLYEGLKNSLNGTISLESTKELTHMVEGATITGPRVSVSPW